MAIHASLCSNSVFVCARRIFYFSLFRLFRKLKQCILLMVFQHFISKLFIGQQELFDCNYDWNACCP